MALSTVTTGLSIVESLQRHIPHELRTFALTGRKLHDIAQEVINKERWASAEELTEKIAQRVKDEIRDLMRLREYNVQEGWE